MTKKSISQLRTEKAIADYEKRQAKLARVQSMWWEGYSNQEIAAITGIPESSVMTIVKDIK